MSSRERLMAVTLKSYKLIVVIAGILTATLVLDMELSNVADILHKDISSPTGVGVFILISLVYLILQFLLLQFSRQNTADLRARRRGIKIIDKFVFEVQISIIIIFLLIIAEIITLKVYEVFFLTLITIVSNLSTLVIMLFLFKRLVQYYKSHPQRTILSYAISALIISVTALITIFFMVPVLVLHSHSVSPDSEVVFPTFVPGSLLDKLNYAYYILSVLSFLSVWAGTVTLLAHYAKKVGRTRFWILMVLPLAFYLGQIAVISLQIPLPFVGLDQTLFIFYYRLIFTISSTIGGVLFSQPFFLVARSIPHESNTFRHLIILGIGMVLFFVSGSATVYHAPYPPFGLPTVALIGISSYLLFLGLYSTTISLSEDMEIYKLISKSAREWKFFLKLGDAEVEKSVLDKVHSVKETMTTESGIAPSISVSDAKDYLTTVLEQLKKEKAPLD
jgi:hypothetical protein